MVCTTDDLILIVHTRLYIRGFAATSRRGFAAGSQGGFAVRGFAATHGRVHVPTTINIEMLSSNADF